MKYFGLFSTTCHNLIYKVNKRLKNITYTIRASDCAPCIMNITHCPTKHDDNSLNSSYQLTLLKTRFFLGHVPDYYNGIF